MQEITGYKNEFLGTVLRKEGMIMKDYSKFIEQIDSLKSDINDKIKCFLNDSQELKDFINFRNKNFYHYSCLLYTSPSPRDLSTSRMPSSA